MRRAIGIQLRTHESNGPLPSAQAVKRTGNTMAAPGGIEPLHRLAPFLRGHAPRRSRRDTNDHAARPGSPARYVRDTARLHAHPIWAPNESDELLRLAVQ